MRKLARWCWRRRGRVAGLTVLALVAGLNGMAYLQARGMTTFVPDAPAWRGADRLSWSARARLLLLGPRIPRPASAERPDSVGLTFETHTFSGEAGRLEGWYIPRPGARSVVLLFHGFTGCKGRLLPEARAWHELGHDCFLLDFRGSGGSEGNTTTIGYHEADDVARTVEYVREHWPGRKVILYGQSMGSAAVLRGLAELDVKADAAVLECPFDRMLTTIKVRFASMGLPTFPAAHLLVFWGGVQHDFNAFAHNPVEYARGVRTPVLLLHGGQDRRVGREDVEAIHDNLAGKAQLHVFDELGHESYVRRQPQGWKAHVEDFVRQVLPSSAPPG